MEEAVIDRVNELTEAVKALAAGMEELTAIVGLLNDRADEMGKRVLALDVRIMALEGIASQRHASHLKRIAEALRKGHEAGRAINKGVQSPYDAGTRRPTKGGGGKSLPPISP